MYPMYRTDLSLRHFWDWCNSDSVPRNAFITLRAMMIMLPSSMQQISHVNSSMTRIIVVWTTSGIAFTWTRVAIYARKPNVQKQIDKTLQKSYTSVQKCLVLKLCRALSVTARLKLTERTHCWKEQIKSSLRLWAIGFSYWVICEHQENCHGVSSETVWCSMSIQTGRMLKMAPERTGHSRDFCSALPPLPNMFILKNRESLTTNHTFDHMSYP